MNEEMNKEMDLLLRRLSRRQDGSMPDAGSSLAGEHLDADELNSYAENALPVAARARYTEHLAECASCRELVVQLSASAGVIAAAEHTSNVPSPSGWRNFLASLFSPMVLRYAVPALGLIVVAAIGLIMMNRSPSLVGRNSPVAEVREARPNEASPSNSIDRFTDTAPPQGEAESRTDTRAKTPQKDVAAPVSVPNVPPAVSSVSADVKSTAPAAPEADPAGATAAASQPQPKPQPTPTPDFNVAIETRKQQLERQGNESAKMMGEKEKAADQTKTEERKTDDSAAATATGVSRREARSPGSRARGAGVQSTANMQVDGVDKDAETRAVAGRRFRKERGIWIDTAYDSGTSTVNLARGSEQYRALVADEPSIKTIAEQLSGEIIVVWKGRAYRIR